MYKGALVFLLSAFDFFSSPSSTFLKLYLCRMSWQSYVDNIMTADQSGLCPIKAVAICGKQGFSVWASSGINVTPEEIKALCGDSKSFAQCGPKIGGYKCRMLRDNKETEGIFSIDFKTSADAEGNTYSVCVAYTLSAVIIAMGTKEASGGQVSSKLYTIISYLRGAGM
ncbi:hypothetical protein Q5P01_003061 [Channa striata]|uniref:Profilin n=1 Tax=Channa striata TaxID=64152 RepID=A0AA88P2C4_CHASR|nr:hypothetical protein Q5P01_003061 [Channa striata]